MSLSARWRSGSNGNNNQPPANPEKTIHISRPLLTLLGCTVRRQLRQQSLWLSGAVYLAIVLVVIFPVAMLNDSRPGLIFQQVQFLNLATAIVIPAMAARQLVDDVASGTLMLMRVAGHSAAQWIGFRLLAIAAVYGPIWVLRLPIYALVLNSGGATMEGVLWAEASTWTVAVVSSQFSLLSARLASVEQAAVVGGIFSMMAVNAAFWLPTVVLGFVRRVFKPSVPLFVGGAVEWLREVSVLNALLRVPGDTKSQFTGLAAVALLLCLGAVATMGLLGLLARQAEQGTLHIPGRPQAVEVKARLSRRVWQDALAWQAATIHCRLSRPGQVALWIVAAMIIAPMSLPAFASASAITAGTIGLWMIAAATTAGMVPSTCLTRELQQGTLASLAMLPLTGRDFYGGWLRGSRAWRNQSFVGVLLALLLILWNAPLQAPFWLLVAVMAARAISVIVFVETLRSTRSPWIGVVRSLVIMGIFMSANAIGFLPVAAIVTVAAVAYRPAALKKIDGLFAEVSSR